MMNKKSFLQKTYKMTKSYWMKCYVKFGNSPVGKLSFMLWAKPVLRWGQRASPRHVLRSMPYHCSLVIILHQISLNRKLEILFSPIIIPHSPIFIFDGNWFYVNSLPHVVIVKCEILPFITRFIWTASSSHYWILKGKLSIHCFYRA